MVKKYATRPGMLLLDLPCTPAERSIEKRRIRKHHVLNCIRMHGPIPRVRIARALDFNLPTVSKMVDELVEEGLVLEEAPQAAQLGRPPVPVILDPNAASVVGVDVGRHHTTVIVLNWKGQTLARLEKPVSAIESDRYDDELVASLIEELLDKELPDCPPIVGIGVGVPGMVRVPGVKKILTPELEVFHDALGERFGVPILIERDLRMAAIGSIWFEEDPDLKTFIVVSIGEGLGVGIVVGRKLYKGIDLKSGEVGHLPFGEPGIPCHCGRSGCLENIVSTQGLERLAKAHGLKAGGRYAKAEDVFRMAMNGSGDQAAPVVEIFTEHLIKAVGISMVMYNPGAIILTGPIANFADAFLEKLREGVAEMTVPARDAAPPIFVSSLKDNAVCIGSCSAVLHHIFYSYHLSVETTL